MHQKYRQQQQKCMNTQLPVKLNGFNQTVNFINDKLNIWKLLLYYLYSESE
jgi:hypothetical protein